MKLSEVLKDWPEKQREYTNNHNETNGIYSHTDYGERYYEIPEGIGFNTALTSCDREIDREVLLKELKSNGHMLTYEEFTDLIISTMPTWLKPINNKENL